MKPKHYWLHELRRRAPARFASVPCDPQPILRLLRDRPNEPLSWFDRAVAIVTSLFKRAGISGWTPTGCVALARGAVVRDAQHSTDGFWTIDVRLESLSIGTRSASCSEPPRFIRLEIEPGTLAHGFCARRFVTAGTALSFGGPVVVDTDGPFLEMHPDRDFELVARIRERSSGRPG